MKASRLELRSVRLRPQSDLEKVFVIAARLSQIVLAVVAAVFVLDYAEIILAPIFLGVVVGLMFSPLARAIERHGAPPWLSGIAVLLLLLFCILFLIGVLSLPLATWIERIPRMWERLRLHVAGWKDMLSSFQELQKQLGEVFGETGGMSVKVDDGGPVQNVVTFGPTIIAEFLLFIASVYFFVATRDQFRLTALRLCLSRRLRWRIAHFFRDAEILISRYLLTITVINFGLGVAVAAALWAIGMPSPILWGLLAMILNYVAYIGPALMTLILLSVSLATRQGEIDILLPPLVYLFLNFIEAQFVTTQVLGVTMTMNPFLVFLALTFWIWIWGPIGGFIAVPSLLVIYALIRNTVGMRDRPATQSS
jgi:predicted PurR-regulated permease PerM